MIGIFQTNPIHDPYLMVFINSDTEDYLPSLENYLRQNINIRRNPHD